MGRSIVPVFCTVTKAFVTSPMPWVISMLVSQPNMTRFTGCTGASVSVSVGGMSVKVDVGDGANVFSAVTGEITVTFEDGVWVWVFIKMGGGMINGVAVTMPGVNDGAGVQTGNVWGAIPRTSHELISIVVSRKKMILFIFSIIHLRIILKRIVLNKHRADKSGGNFFYCFL